jgi:anti-sigma factor RsiW
MMSTPFTCDDKPTLIAYLYGEVDAATRHLVDAHLATCQRCAAEVAALGDVRAELALWAPPDAALGFTITRKSEPHSATVLRPARWWSTVPAWVQAAAAVLVIAAGAGIANLQVRSGPDGFSVSTGWIQPTAATVSAPVQENNEAWRTALVALEQQLRTEIRSTHEQTAVRAAAPSADEATIRRVQQLIAASEERQQRELALRLTQFNADMNMQRRADLMRITNSFGQFGDQMMQQRQMLNNVLRVSATGQQ